MRQIIVKSRLFIVSGPAQKRSRARIRTLNTASKGRCVTITPPGNKAIKLATISDYAKMVRFEFGSAGGDELGKIRTILNVMSTTALRIAN